MTVGISHLLNADVAVRRQVPVEDGQGGFSNTLQTVATIKGRRNPASYRDRLAAGREEAQVTHVWFCDPGSGIRMRDVLVSNGVQYDVLASMPPSANDFEKWAVKEIQLGTTA